MVSNGANREADPGYTDPKQRSCLEWMYTKPEWFNSRVTLNEDQTEVLFNPEYSVGTAIAIGDRPLEKGRHHYWEMKITGPFYGTSAMIGIVTTNFKKDDYRFTFEDLFGKDEHSWGYSKSGTASHSGVVSKIRLPSWNKDETLGVHADLWRGNLTLFCNQRKVATVYNNLLTASESSKLYPVISSTTANSSIKLVTAVSSDNDLTFESLKAIAGLGYRTQESLMKQLPPRVRQMLCRDLHFALEKPSSTGQVKILSESEDYGASAASFLRTPRRNMAVSVSRRTPRANYRDSEQDYELAFTSPSDDPPKQPHNRRNRQLRCRRRRMCHFFVNGSSSSSSSSSSEEDDHQDEEVVAKEEVVAQRPAPNQSTPSGVYKRFRLKK